MVVYGIGMSGLQATEVLNGEKAMVDEVPFFNSRFSSELNDSNGFPDLSLLNRCSLLKQPVKRLLLSPEVHLAEGEKKIKMLADSVPENSENRTHLTGNVSVRDESSLLKANEIIFNHQTEQIDANGGVSYESKAAFFRADSLSQTKQNNQIQIKDATFYLFSNHANGKADNITVVDQKYVELKKLSFSTCPVNEQRWQLKASEMNVDQKEGRGEAWNSVLRINDIPVFYFPYINFPTDDRRKSGLLSPSVKVNDKNGFDIEQPIYWNIAPAMDATITPRLIKKRGAQLGGEFRWLTEIMRSQVNFEWLHEDQEVKQTQNNINHQNTGRWLGQLSSQAQFNQNWLLKIDAKRVSDSDYFRDFSSGLGASNETRLSSQLSLSYQDTIWQMNWFALAYQSLIDSESYRYLPSWQAAADYTADNGFRWQWSSEATQFAHKNEDQIEGVRLNAMPSISYPMSAMWGFLTPKLSYQVSRYEQASQLTGDKTTISRELPILSIDSGVFFDRKIQIGKSNYTHSFEPRAFYTYIPHREQNLINVFDTTESDFGFDRLWRENRFTGIDRVGDTNQISLSFTNRLHNNKTGDETAHLSIGRIYYFADRKVQLSQAVADSSMQSPWLAEVGYQLNASLSLSALIQWDEQNKQTQKAQTQINFEPKDNHIVNLTHRYRDIAGQLNEEIDFSFAWPINERWRLLGKWYNDLQQKQTIETLIGVEYESCCWAIRLVAQKYLNAQLNNVGLPVTLDDDRYSDGIYLQFVFKGLGSAGQSGLSHMLSSSITGYQDPFSQQVH